MSDTRQNSSGPFRGWSPFGLLPVLTWPTWASPRLPDHFRECPSTVRTASPCPRPDTEKIIDLEEYRQRRLAKPNVAPSQLATALHNDH